ncbi:MAG: hypothetical protein KDK35_11045 [Leptospiraceae bacterium]|nr:hypothetical protein [Leptospiraceae bacterium]MCP5485858.1 hypothetical protein [Spirochaetales bacterium]
MHEESIRLRFLMVVTFAFFGTLLAIVLAGGLVGVAWFGVRLLVVPALVLLLIGFCFLFGLQGQSNPAIWCATVGLVLLLSALVLTVSAGMGRDLSVDASCCRFDTGWTRP